MKYRSLFWLMLLLFLLSCGEEEEQVGLYTVGVSLSTPQKTWRSATERDMKIEASRYPEMKLLFENSEGDTDEQIRQVRRFIDEKVDALIVSPNDQDGPLAALLVEAYRSGIPTIIIDRVIDSDEYTTYIGADNYKIGTVAGSYVNNIRKKKKLKILEIWGSRGSSSARERHQGFVDVLRDFSDITFTEMVGKWNGNVVWNKMFSNMAFKDIDIVYAHNDVMALAARKVIEAIDPEAVDSIRFIGVDAMPGKDLGLEAIVEGRLDASCLYPTGGNMAIRVVRQVLEGTPVSHRYVLSTALIDKENAGSVYVQSEQMLEYQHQIEQQKDILGDFRAKYKFLRNSLAIILVLMSLLLLSAFYYVYINRQIRSKNRALKKTNRKIEQQKEELEMANNYIKKETMWRMQFFTNITHEIKTPLTLILGPLGKVIKEVPKDWPVADDLLIVRRNAERLKRVVEQLLDFRKVENNKMTLHVTPIDMVPFVKEVNSCFETVAGMKQIDFSFVYDEKQPVCLWGDRDKVEKILTNLLSNAFKFTSVGGRITVSLKEEEQNILLSVEDNGVGIPPENCKSVFESFFTGDQNNVAGTGIGLHLTQEFVMMHKGTIEVTSTPGVSTLFTVRFPKGNAHLEDCDMVKLPASDFLKDIDLNLDEMQRTLQQKYAYTVLVVEDDLEIRDFIEQSLAENFRVLTAGNGVEALNLLLREEVNIVVSDVMMPEMNGFDLCQKIKSDIVLSHIPVFLLTALYDDVQRMYGLSGGADDYLQKPFNIEELKLRIIRQMEMRERWRAEYAQSLQSFEPSEKKEEEKRWVGADALFMDRFVEMIASSYMDSEFNIEKGSEQLGLSRVHLYRKVKALTGVTPTDYLRNYRLQQAAVLLKERSVNVNEVAYATGFSSPSYFSKCFRLLYHLTPSEFSSRQQNS